MPNRQFQSSITVELPGVSAGGDASLVLAYTLLDSGRLQVNKETMYGALEGLRVGGESRIVSGLASISCPAWKYEASRVPVEITISDNGVGQGTFRPPEVPPMLVQLIEGSFVENSESAGPAGGGIATVISPTTANLQLTGHAPSVNTSRTVRVPIVGTLDAGDAEPQARQQLAGSVTPTGSLEIVKLEGAQNSDARTRADFIRRRAEVRATVLVHVEDAIAQLRELQQSELDKTERLIADYAIADLERVSSLVDLDSDEVASVLESRTELHEVRGRLERARDFFLRMREPVAQRLVAEAILRVATTLAGL